MRSKQYPVATMIVLVATGVLTSLQFTYPEIVSLLERTPVGISQNQWWRLITPLFVHPEGWRQIAFNFPSILVVGVLVERIFGSWRWLMLYFVSGFIGELAGYAWKPVGAGASVAGAGLLGALGIWFYRMRVLNAAAGQIPILLYPKAEFWAFELTTTSSPQHLTKPVRAVRTATHLAGSRR